MFYDSERNSGKGAFWRQVDWQQVGALARAGSPVFFRDKSPNVEKMARTGGTKYSFLQMI